MRHQVLPAVRDTRVTDRAGAETRRGHQAQGAIIARCKQSLGVAIVGEPGGIASAVVAEVRRHQHVDPVVLGATLERCELQPHQQHRPLSVRDDFGLQAESPLQALAANGVVRHAGTRAARQVPGMTLDLGDEAVWTHDQEPDVARRRLVDARRVDLVDDAVRQCKPDGATAERGAHTALCCRSPPTGDPRCTGREIFSHCRQAPSLPSAAVRKFGVVAHGTVAVDGAAGHV